MISDNERSPYFYQWDDQARLPRMALPPTPTTPTKPQLARPFENKHIRMKSLDLNDSYSIASIGESNAASASASASRSDIDSDTASTSTASTADSQNFSVRYEEDDEFDFTTTTGGSSHEHDLSQQLSDYYSRRVSVKRHFPPLPSIPLPKDLAAEPQLKLPRIHEDSVLSLVDTTQQDEIDDTYLDFSWQKPEYHHLKRRSCPESVCIALFVLSILAVPCSLCVYLGFLDEPLGQIPRRWKIAHLVSFCAMSLLCVVGIIVGLALGVK